MTNQSELEQLLDYLYEKGYDSGDGMSKYPKDVAILETQAKIERYITANYTPKSDIPNFMRPGNLIPYTIINGVKYVELDWLITELTKE